MHCFTLLVKCLTYLLFVDTAVNYNFPPSDDENQVVTQVSPICFVLGRGKIPIRSKIVEMFGLKSLRGGTVMDGAKPEAIAPTKP